MRQDHVATLHRRIASVRCGGVLVGHRAIVLKGRPSSIHETITIDLPNSRTRETIRHPRFAELREQVWGTLMREVREAKFVLER
jgi:ABC-type nitrate/sulfonate/bicarbonate transport system ATPase subunit